MSDLYEKHVHLRKPVSSFLLPCHHLDVLFATTIVRKLVLLFALSEFQPRWKHDLMGSDTTPDMTDR